MRAANRNNGTPALITSLRHAGCYPHPATDIQLLETHISWVLLTGVYAYKIKKPVNLGFLDFSTLEQRRRYCAEELRLNRRLAPQLYLDVVCITGNVTAPRVAGDGVAIEYAVKMRQFPQDALAKELLATGKLDPQQLQALAGTLAAFHQATAASDAASAFGTPQSILDAVLQNFDQLLPLLTGPGDAAAIAALRMWTMREYGAQQTLMERRRVAGAVRECHGDLHLGNIVLIAGRLVPFDCIEFSPALRWNDVISEAAFLVMDLHGRGSPRLGWLFLNAYLEHAGDYQGVALLPFYLVYRAMVRAKIHGLRATQPGLDDAERARLLHASRDYLALAERFAHRPDPVLIITHGLSGSGKSRVAEELMQQLGAVRIRSDVERKRGHGRAPQERNADGIGGGIYSDRATQTLYAHLASLARIIVTAGCTVIVDAAFLMRWQRDLLRDAARDTGVCLLILAITAPHSVLHDRIRQRAAAGNDPSDAGIAVLESQLQIGESLTEDERAVALELSNDDEDPSRFCQPVAVALATMQKARVTTQRDH